MNADSAGPLVTAKEVIGAMAMWAVRQHPRHNPPGLNRITARLLEEANGWPDGAPSLPMRRFSDVRSLDRWLHEVLAEHPVLTLWNSFERGKTPDLVFSSRFDGPGNPDYDFIDIDALLRNVAMTVMRDAERGQEADRGLSACEDTPPERETTDP